MQHKRNRSSSLQTMYGTAKDISLKGITRYAHLHVFGMVPTTTPEIITKYLTERGINDTKCNQLKSKHPEDYASFKVSVPFERLEEVKKSDIWPAGARINRFLERIARRSAQTT